MGIVICPQDMNIAYSLIAFTVGIVMSVKVMSISGVLARCWLCTEHCYLHSRYEHSLFTDCVYCWYCDE